MGVVEIVYAEVPKLLWKAAAINVSQHLNKLEKERKVESKQNGDETVWRYLNCK